MTTTVVVRANHGWDVLVDHIEENKTIRRDIVRADTEQQYVVWQGRSILVTELKPDIIVDMDDKMVVFTEDEYKENLMWEHTAGEEKAERK